MKVRLTAATLVILVGLTTAPFVLAQDDKQPDSKPAPDPTQTQPNSKPDSKPAATDAQPAALPEVVPQNEHVDVKLVQEPVLTKYVNRIAQNLVRNSDATVPFTIKVVDSEEVNTFALTGRFF